MFSWHGPNPDSLSIMTFSEIGPGSRKSNAFDRCLSLQLQKKEKKIKIHQEREGQEKHLERERERESWLLRFLELKLLGNIRFYQLSLPHCRYLNISKHECTCRAESASGEHMLLPN